jgi:pyruvate/2-oxoglutarate dehydrogenase complex dihydrolipoamide acyltransferase (E2) component
MATKVVMEALSPTMEEGRLVKWLKNEGDPIKAGEVLAEVETDKAIMELVARGDGVLRKRLANEGDASPVGTLLAVIAPADENIDALIAGAAPAPAAAAAAPSAPADAPAATPAAPAAAGAPPDASPVPPAPAESRVAS